MTGPARRPSSRRAASLVWVAVFSVLVSACGLAVNASPTRVSPKQVPFGLLHKSPPTTSPTRRGQYVTIYLDGPQSLVAVSREVPVPVSAGRVLVALTAGPTSAEAAQNWQSPISTAAPLTLGRLSTTDITVNVTGAFTKLAGADQVIAAAQLVYTLTALPGIQSVTIRIDGKRAKVPTGKGTLNAGPLDRADYATVAPI